MQRGDEQAALALADEVAAGCLLLLGDVLLAVVLHGSLVLGGFTPARSDVDLLAVVERPLGDDELAALQALVARVGPGALDIRVVTRVAAASPTRSPAMELYVGRHRATEIQTRVAGERDLVAELSIVRSTGRSLVGPEPRALVGVVPDAWVIEYGDEILARWERLTDDADNAELMVLTACRIWRFAVEHLYCSKSSAGRWAIARDPSLTAIEAALRQRGGEPTVRVDPADIARLLALVRGELAAQTR